MEKGGEGGDPYSLFLHSRILLWEEEHDETRMERMDRKMKI